MIKTNIGYGMFIKSFKTIKNIGQIKDYSAPTDLLFEKLTTIYGKNGVGKTTLATIFRSLQTGKDNLLKIKKTIGSKNAPQIVEIVTDLDTIKFDGTQWSKTIQDIEIFDSYFVNKNIYSGYYVDVEHQKNLPDIILGEEGVSLAETITKSKEDLTKLSTKEALILSDLRLKDLSLNNIDKIETFYKLGVYLQGGATIPNFDERIKEKQNEIALLKKIATNSDKKPFEIITFKFFDTALFSEHLSKTLDSIAKDAEAKIKQHIANFNMNNPTWLEQGKNYLNNTHICPFCCQPIDNSDIINAYKDCFSEIYNSFKSDLSNYSDIKDSLSNEAIFKITNTIQKNITIKKLFGESLPDNDKWVDLDIEAIQVIFSSFHNKLNEIHKQKIDSPLEKIYLDDDFNSLFAKYKSIDEQISLYNDFINICNEKLDKLNPDDIPNKEASLNDTIRLKLRHIDLKDYTEVNIKPLIDKKYQLNKLINNSKNNLKTYSENIVCRYEEKINEYLKDFSTNFLIRMGTPSYRTDKPSIGFHIEIDKNTEEQISIRTLSLENGMCLGNSLSDGDKTALAFAFFMAKLDLDQNITSKIIIIDDPISSLDKQRRDQTLYCCIKKLLPKVSQLFILSHDERFLNECYKHNALRNNKEKISLEIIKQNPSLLGSELLKCDLTEYTKSDFIKSYEILNSFSNGKSEHALEYIIKNLRIYLEGLLQNLYPTDFKEGHPLGTYVGFLKDHPKHVLYKVFQTIDSTNDFAIKYEHSCNKEPPEMSTVKTYVDKALGIISIYPI